jgi:hypothetical protein
MSDNLESLIKSYSDDYLLEQCYQKREEYGAYAVGLMEAEIGRRMISADRIAEYREGKKDESVVAPGPGRHHSREEFIGLDDLFTPTDILLVNAMFDEAKIPFFVDNPPSRTFPTESLSATVLKIHVHRDKVAEAHALLDEHFVKEEGRYRVRYSNNCERLKALNFHEVHVDETAAETDVGVALAPAEIAAVSALAKRLIEEVDEVEAAQERTVFYYDNLEDLVGRLKRDPAAALSKTDFLTLTEILQIYCDDPAFPAELSDTVAAILAFFEGTIRET